MKSLHMIFINNIYSETIRWIIFIVEVAKKKKHLNLSYIMFGNGLNIL